MANTSPLSCTELERSLNDSDTVKAVYKVGYTTFIVTSIFGSKSISELLHGTIMTKINSKELHLIA